MNTFLLVLALMCRLYWGGPAAPADPLLYYTDAWIRKNYPYSAKK